MNKPRDPRRLKETERAKSAVNHGKSFENYIKNTLKVKEHATISTDLAGRLDNRGVVIEAKYVGAKNPYRILIYVDQLEKIKNMRKQKDLYGKNIAPFYVISFGGISFEEKTYLVKAEALSGLVNKKEKEISMWAAKRFTKQQLINLRRARRQLGEIEYKKKRNQILNKKGSPYVRISKRELDEMVKKGEARLLK